MRQPSADAARGEASQGCRKTPKGAGRKTGQHVKFGEPAWSACRLHDKLARLAVQRLKMAMIAGRYSNSRRGGNVEAGFVVKKNNMRKFSHGMASRGRCRIQAIACAGVRFEISMRGEFTCCLDAGTREF